MIVSFNDPVKLGKSFHGSSWNDFPFKCKNASLDVVYSKSSSILKEILDAAPLEHKHKYICVDVKPIHTVVGQCVCLPGWHLDTVENPFNSLEKNELHHLICLLSDDTTEYISTPLSLDIDPSDTLKTIRSKIEEHEYEVFKAPKNTYVSYTRMNFHRGPIALNSSKRVLIRLSESDVIRPNKDLYTL